MISDLAKINLAGKRPAATIKKMSEAPKSNNNTLALLLKIEEQEKQINQLQSTRMMLESENEGLKMQVSLLKNYLGKIHDQNKAK